MNTASRQLHRDAAAARMSEADLLATVRALAHATGWATYHAHDSRRSEPGWPDLVLAKGNRLLYRELKTQRGRVRPDQERWLDLLATAGADACIWRPADLLDRTIHHDLGITR